MWIGIEVQFLFLMKNIIFLVLLRVKIILGSKTILTHSKLEFFGPGGPKLIWRSNFCFFHFLKKFIISFFFENTLKMFVWVWPIILWTEKNTHPSDVEFFSDSKLLVVTQNTLYYHNGLCLQHQNMNPQGPPNNSS